MAGIKKIWGHSSFHYRSIFTRLFAGIMGMVVCIMAIAAFFISYQSQATLNEKTKQQLHDASGAALQNVHSRVYDIVTALQSFASTYKNSTVTNSQIFGIFTDMTINNPTISELQIVTTDGRYLTFPGSPLDSSYDPRKTDWYEGALNQTQHAAFVSDVFQFSETEFPKIAVSLPLRNEEEESVGVVVAFVSVPKLSESIGQIKLGETGYAMIVDHQGKLVAHPDQSYALQRPLLTELPVVQNVIAGQSGYEPSKINGIDSFAAYQFDPSLKWGVIVVQSVSEVKQEVRRLQLTILAVSLVGLVALALLLYVYVRRIINPIKEAQQKMTAFSEGDLLQTMQVQSNDEIRQLADSFNRMSEQIRTIIGKIQYVISDVKQVADHVGKGSRHSHAMQTEVVSVTERLAQEMDNQQEQIEEINLTMNEITQEMSRITSSMEEAILQSQESREQNAMAAASMNTLKQNMHSISEDMKASIQAMSSMRESMGDINEMLGLISAISKRTKLLSFNARIEASRAGQAGIGFSVVADEIRLLSDQTEEASARIQQVIASGEERMEHVAACLETTDHATVNGIQTLHQAASIFNNTVQLSEALTAQFETIRALTGTISAQSQVISQRVDNLSASAQQVVSGTQQAVAANQESLSLSEQFLDDSLRLTEIVEDLEQTIKFFRAGETTLSLKNS
ncbi:MULTISPECIES: methyl-accepting chemotaxis protein [Brevibacillus]|uniref:methyl-accepting chemotaxis protein n=1 Tax=Brevibacillus TaxID=55080 RepID=UPI000D0E5CA4|nr:MULTISPECIES: methyl-accepting chemotaxis protein [Brevibacillus]PSJ71027.1 methyl-accepting chemotaxis protein [Brevibacillus brevis]RED24391.1 methyl-accepting chemotaxis sensory transducer with Cache sensor [Brevibacillus brevis]TQK49602.1 methyl-accepting chemotaxis sensory transducer with Cache sensor [Brevibacillus sp. AG162]VEF91778.1 H3 [Brevibacillus brevis]GEC93670.1 methyl-accepting chemotaxis protein [Brevibacillus brevis]